MRKTLAIVGGGFSGTVLAANLLRRPPSDATDIVLIERGPSAGRGVAYAAREFPYLLNVPAARLSADSEDALQFLHFAQRRMPEPMARIFCRARCMATTCRTCCRAPNGPRPPMCVCCASRGRFAAWCRATATARSWRSLRTGAPMAADAVILALGNPPPALLPWAAAIRDHAAYRHDPWDLPKTLSAEHSVLIVGNGLTMADAASALSQDPGRAPALHTISRHGVVPQPQTDISPERGARRRRGVAGLRRTRCGRCWP